MTVRFIIALALFNMTSVRVGRVLLTLYAIKLGAEPIFIGVLAAGFSVIPVCLSWAAGRWSDRFGARWLLLIGVGGSAAGMLLPYFAPGLPAILAAGVLSGLSMSFCNVCLQNLVGILSTPANRAQNFSNYTLANSLSAFTGPLIAGFSIDHAGLGTTCLVVMALAVVPLAMLVLRGKALPRGRRQARSAGGLWHAVSAPGVWRVLAISSVGQTGTDLFAYVATGEGEVTIPLPPSVVCMPGDRIELMRRKSVLGVRYRTGLGGCRRGVGEQAHPVSSRFSQSERPGPTIKRNMADGRRYPVVGPGLRLAAKPG